MGRRMVWVVAALLLTATHAFAQKRGIVLAGVAFGTSPAAVTTAMADLGLRPAVLADRGNAFPLDQTFAGTLDGRQVLVVTMYDADDGLEKMVVSFITSDRECLRFYREFKSRLTQEFGETHADVEDWKAPYDDGRHVGHEEVAIRSGKAFVAATWEREDLGSSAGMSLSVGGNLTVTLTYESATWARELDRRRKLLMALPHGGGSR
jgi:hypothetical protein